MSNKLRLMTALIGLIFTIIYSFVGVVLFAMGIFVFGVTAPWALICVINGVFPAEQVESTLISILIGLLMIICGFLTIKCIKPICKEFQGFIDDR